MNIWLLVRAIGWWLIAMIAGGLALMFLPATQPDADYLIAFLIGLSIWLVPGLVAAFQAADRRAHHAACAGAGAVLILWGYAAISSALVFRAVRIPMMEDSAMVNFGRFIVIPVLIPACIGWMRDRRARGS